VEPPELQRLVDFAERPRTSDWSLRSALVRYAQPQPERASTVLSLARRIEWALHQHSDLLRRHGDEIWAGVAGDGTPAAGPLEHLIELLRAAERLDRLGDDLARWADDVAGPRPDAEIDDVTADVAHKIDALGVPPESAPPRSARA